MQMLLFHSIHSSGARLGGTAFTPPGPDLVGQYLMQGVKVEIERFSCKTS